MAKKRFNPPKKTGNTKYQTADVYRQSYSHDELLSIRRQYAKRANQRMLRLERSGASIGNEPALAYLRQIGRRRFSETKGFKGTAAQLKREISTLSGFLSSERSTVIGRKSIVNKTLQTMTDRYGLDLDSDEGRYLLEHFDEFKAAVAMNSEALLQAIGAVAGDITKPEQIKDIIKELKGRKTVKDQADAIYKAMYGRKRKGAAAMKADITAAIIK